MDPDDSDERISDAEPEDDGKYNEYLKTLPQILGAHKKEWRDTHSRARDNVRTEMLFQVATQVDALRKLRIFESTPEGLTCEYGSGSCRASVVFVLASPYNLDEFDDEVFPNKIIAFLHVFAQQYDMSLADAYFMNYLPWRSPRSRIDDCRDELSYLFPYFLRRLQIIRPRAVAMLGGPMAGVLRTYLKPERKVFTVVHGDTYADFEMGTWKMRFLTAPNPFATLLDKKKPDEDRAVYEARCVSDDLKWQGLFSELAALLRESSSVSQLQKVDNTVVAPRKVIIKKMPDVRKQPTIDVAFGKRVKTEDQK